MLEEGQTSYLIACRVKILKFGIILSKIIIHAKKELYHESYNICINIFNLWCQTLLQILNIIDKDSFYK